VVGVDSTGVRVDCTGTGDTVSLLHPERDASTNNNAEQITNRFCFSGPNPCLDILILACPVELLTDDRAIRFNPPKCPRAKLW
jgi:hypothetical protein